jgi:hypothetical protein
MAAENAAVVPSGDTAAQLDRTVAPAPKPVQLIKQASLAIALDDVDGGIGTTRQLLTRYQGDLLDLSDQVALRSGEPRRIYLRLRVPQENLDAMLEELKALGEVRQQGITAEDVSAQLVDLQARVRNLKKSEEALLEIMERSGSIADVLAVSQELSAVREGIERTEAQFKNLQAQVAFSTISLTFESTRVVAHNAPVAGILGNTWRSASQSVRGFSIALLQGLLWLLAYSPYVAIALLILGGGYRVYRHQHATSAAPTEESPSA